MALQTGLRHPDRLAGIMALSCFLPLAETVATEGTPANRETPIFMAHGERDPLIPGARGRQARDLLAGVGYRVAWHEYVMPHSVCGEEVADIARWLTSVLNGN